MDGVGVLVGDVRRNRHIDEGFGGRDPVGFVYTVVVAVDVVSVVFARVAVVAVDVDGVGQVVGIVGVVGDGDVDGLRLLNVDVVVVVVAAAAVDDGDVVDEIGCHEHEFPDNDQSWGWLMI